MDCKTCRKIVQEEERETKEELRTWTGTLDADSESPVDAHWTRVRQYSFNRREL